MKILYTPALDANPSKAAAPEPVATASLPVPTEQEKSRESEEWSARMLAELRQLQGKQELARAQGDEQLRQTTQAIAKLTEEMAVLRKVMAESLRPMPAPPNPQEVLSVTPLTGTPAVQPAQAPAENPVRAPGPVPSGLLDALAGPAPATEKKEERKVAFFKKLWDYLNHVAFEIPPRKQDRTG